MQTKNLLLFTMISKNKGYHLKTKKEKSKILDEYCKVTGQHRKAVIRKIRNGKYIKTMKKETGVEKRKRKVFYSKYLVSILIKIWQIFDRPCGQRLKPLIDSEIEHLQKLGEITISRENIVRLKKMSARTIDYRLAPQKEKERINKKYKRKIHPLLYQKIPIKLSQDQGRGVGETIQIDLVEHCGMSSKGRFINTVSTTDIGTGWWEGVSVFGKATKDIHNALYVLEKRYPFPWGELHPDNGSEFINEMVYDFTLKHGIKISRSRPYRKNDNCFIEQKNSTHVRKMVGHHRYCTAKELNILNSLYSEDLSFYKNFFQPIIPLKTKERIAGHIKRTYGIPKTPYQNVMDSKNISQETKQELTKIYQSLNPADLKRKITEKQNVLLKLTRQKNQEQNQEQKKQEELINLSVANLIADTVAVR